MGRGDGGFKAGRLEALSDGWVPVEPRLQNGCRPPCKSTHLAPLGSEGRGSPPSLTPLLGQAEEAEDGIQKEEKEEEAAASGSCMGEEVLRKAPEEGRLDFHPLLSR